MPIYGANSAAVGGLLRGLSNRKVESPVGSAGFSPAIANLSQEPLSRKTPTGTDQIIANKPSLDLTDIQNQLAQAPVPTPEQAAELIQAMVTPPSQGEVLGASTQNNTYTVKSGDTLSKIAQQYGVSPQAITGYRSGNPNLIYPGEVLTIGGGNAPLVNRSSQVDQPVAQTQQPQVSYPALRGAGPLRPGQSRTTGRQSVIGGPLSRGPVPGSPEAGYLAVPRKSGLVHGAYAEGPTGFIAPKTEDALHRVLRFLGSFLSGANAP